MSHSAGGHHSSTPNHLYAVDAVNNRVLGYASATTFANGGAADDCRTTNGRARRDGGGDGRTADDASQRAIGVGAIGGYKG